MAFTINLPEAGILSVPTNTVIPAVADTNVEVGVTYVFSPTSQITATLPTTKPSGEPLADGDTITLKNITSPNVPVLINRNGNNVEGLMPDPADLALDSNRAARFTWTTFSIGGTTTGWVLL